MEHRRGRIRASARRRRRHHDGSHGCVRAHRSKARTSGRRSGLPPNFVPEWSLVAELDGRIVGHVMVSYVALVDEATRTSRSPASRRLAVATDLHGRGIGSALSVRSSRAPTKRANRLVVLEGDPAYYGRLRIRIVRAPRHPHHVAGLGAARSCADRRGCATTTPRSAASIVYPPAFGVLEQD